MKSVLRPHQRRALADLKAAFLAGRRRPLVQSPTGSGKTILAAAVVEGALDKGNRVAFVVPRISLVDQTRIAFFAEGIHDTAVMQACHRDTNPAAPVQICSADTITKRGWPQAGVVVIDEAHVVKQSVVEWMQHPDWRNVPFIGLSATPWTKGLGRYYDELIVAATVKQMIREGLLSPFKVYAPSHPDLRGVRISHGDYNEKDLGAKADQSALVGDVVTTWLERGRGRPTVLFAVDRAHAALLQRRFTEAGVRAEYADCHTPLPERAAIERRLRSGETEVVCNVDIFGIGVDWDVRCLILARPTRSIVRFVQNVGRGLRTAPDKDHLLILDHSDSHIRLGFVSDIARDKLDMGKPRGAGAEPERKPKLPKPCPRCAVLIPAGFYACGECGWKPEPVTKARHVNGELAEFTPESRALAKRRSQFSPEEKRHFLAQLVGYANERGYKRGWALHKFEEKFKHPPDNRWVEPEPPTSGVLSWIRSRQIAWALSKRRGGCGA